LLDSLLQEMKLIAVWLACYFHWAGAANIGVDVDSTKVTAHVSLGNSEIFCNQNDKERAGCCVPAGSCGVAGPSKNGVSVGKCAQKDKLGQQMDCCSMHVHCGEITEDYVSYFTNPNWPESEEYDSSCNIKIAVKKNVCQIRLDFLSFELPPPDRKTGICLNNNRMLIFAHSNPVEWMGKKNHGFCGFNSNQHIYLPVKAYHDKVNILTSITKNQHSYHEDDEYKGHPEEKEHHKVEVNVRWNIKITQIDCSSYEEFSIGLRAPDGCLQYFKEKFGTILSFNYAPNSRITPNQDYAVCIRRSDQAHSGVESCSITYRSEYFKMPVGGKDIGQCEDGTEIVNRKTNQECCLDPRSGYLGFVGQQPHAEAEHDDCSATRRYWCGKNLGPVGEVTADTKLPIIKVVTGRSRGHNHDSDFTASGFKIDYSIDAGC